MPNLSDAICSKYGCLMLFVADHDAIRAKGEKSGKGAHVRRFVIPLDFV